MTLSSSILKSSNQLLPLTFVTENRKEKDKNKILIPTHAANNFGQSIEFFYEQAKKDVIRRNENFRSGLKMRGVDEIFERDSTLPVDPDTSIFDYTVSAEEFEGGKEEDKAQTPRERLSTQRNMVDTNNQILMQEGYDIADSFDDDLIAEGGQKDNKVADRPGVKNHRMPKVKGEYPKIVSQQKLRKLKQEQKSQAKTFNKAVDLYLEENNVLFDYKGYDESLKPNEPNARNPELYENYNINDKRKDEYNPPDEEAGYYYAPESNYVSFTDMPDKDGLKYVPPLFREKYELCIWKLDTHNIVKVKSRYFTPQVRASLKNLDSGS